MNIEKIKIKLRQIIMVRIFKIVFVCATVLSLVSCLSKKETSMYEETYAVVRSTGTIKYFSADAGINLVPRDNVWDTAWGKPGERVYVAFYYNPYAMSEDYSTYVTVEGVMKFKVYDTALLPDTDPSVTGLGNILNFTDSYNNINPPVAWAAQGFLTVVLCAKYSDPSKHTFGFIETPNLYTPVYRPDTLNLRIWHNAQEAGKDKVSRYPMSLKLDNYMQPFSDSAVIAIKFKAEDYNGNESEKTIYTKYKKNSSFFGY